MGVKALGMLSGGLDSSLAAKILMDLGLEVEGVNFSTGFCVTEHTRNFKSEKDRPVRANEALRLAADLKFKLHIIDISKDYLPVVTDPKYGYGANMNPCIDCRIFMLKHMKGLMEKFGAQFVFTGEVLGQRPMSQHRDAMKTIETQCGLSGLVLRPLSAQLLDPTIPELKGWVDRKKLLALSGRSRKPQIELAAERGLEDTPQPAGGCCFLADPQFSLRLRDFFDHEGKENLTHETVILLKVGRHIRVSDRMKVIVGRNEKENNFLKAYERGRHAFWVPDTGSPHVLAEIRGQATAEDLAQAASIAVRYCDLIDKSAAKVMYRFDGVETRMTAAGISEPELAEWRI